MTEEEKKNNKDVFVADAKKRIYLKETFGGVCAEMEGAAIAHVCHVNKKPFVIIRTISDVPIISHATDYRLLDRKVITAFNALPERNRITRGLIDWLGFKRGIIYFEANERLRGAASYSTFKLIQLVNI